MAAASPHKFAYNAGPSVVDAIKAPHKSGEASQGTWASDLAVGLLRSDPESRVAPLSTDRATNNPGAEIFNGDN